MFPSQKCGVSAVGYCDCLASMGPGCFHPRNAPWISQLAGFGVLQWGRDVSIPEMSSVGLDTAVHLPASTGPGCFHHRNMLDPAHAIKTTWLQWGRDVSIPEISTRSRGCIRN